MKLITRVCRCRDNEFEVRAGTNQAGISRCDFCQMNCNYHGPFCKER